MVTSKSAEVGDRILKVTFCFILMEEIWKDIEGYEGKYKISTTGKVLSCGIDSLNRNYGKRIRKQFKDKNGYLSVFLIKNDVHKRFYVHRLVAKTFIPNPENKPCVDHVDGNRNNNNYTNLRWCTYKENNNFDIYRKRNSRAKEKRVIQLTKDGVFIKEWDSTKIAQETLKIYGIYECLKGRSKSAGGFKWIYK